MVGLLAGFHVLEGVHLLEDFVHLVQGLDDVRLSAESGHL